MSGKFSFIQNTYGGISKHMWILATAMFINRCGSMVLLFMSVYLTKHMHLTIPQAGVVMAMFGAGSLVGAFAGGKLVDKLGYYPIMIVSLLLSGIMLLILGYMQSYLLIAVFTFLVTATGDAFRPANAASISHYSSKEHYPRSIALNRLAMNLGFTIGPVLGGLLASVNYHFLFWADGLTCISAALFIYVVLPKPSQIKEQTDTVHTNQEPETAPPAGGVNYDSPYQDHFYLGFIVCTTLYATAFFQFFTSLPLYYKNVYHLPEKHIGWLMAFNGFGVVLIEMFLIYYIQQKWTQFKFISLGIVLLAAGFLILIPLHGITILILSMFLITLSEMFAMPFMSTYAMTRAPKISMGQYMALYSMGWSTAQILAPVIGTTIIDRYGFDILWIVLSGIALIAFIGFRWLEKAGATKTLAIS
jgi:MFS family permease